MINMARMPLPRTVATAALALLLLVAGSVVTLFIPNTLRAAPTPFTDPGKTDFDTFLRALKDLGTWEKRGDYYVFRPARPCVPMTNGTWLYTDWGWYWKGNEPHSFITDHYGAWIRQNGSWVWRPDGMWSPHKIEWRTTDTHIGWRPTQVNPDGDFLEPDDSRYANPEEWIFIEKSKLRGVVQASDVITGANSLKHLESSEPSWHVYTTYREIERAGPDPAKTLPLFVDNRPRAELNTPTTARLPEPRPRPAVATTPPPAPTSPPQQPAAAPSQPSAPQSLVPEVPASPAGTAATPPADGGVAPLLPEGETPAAPGPDATAGGPAPLLPEGETAPAPTGSAPTAHKPAPRAPRGPSAPPLSSSGGGSANGKSRFSSTGAMHPLYGTSSFEGGGSEEVKKEAPRYKVYSIMSLPAINTPIPPAAKATEVYVYRPRLYQDGDGINRRIEIFLNPATVEQKKKELSKILGSVPASTTDKSEVPSLRPSGVVMPGSTPPRASAVAPAPESPTTPAPISAPAPRKPVSTQSSKR
ncbi:hypothetical protein DB346_25110 [Verrucomicrobia bacterium LW23]|nr:hypothetical protein DB346_25110 [Verrucomicrobia bacterium LW23]